VLLCFFTLSYECLFFGPKGPIPPPKPPREAPPTALLVFLRLTFSSSGDVTTASTRFCAAHRSTSALHALSCGHSRLSMPVLLARQSILTCGRVSQINTRAGTTKTKMSQPHYLYPGPCCCVVGGGVPSAQRCLPVVVVCGGAVEYPPTSSCTTTTTTRTSSQLHAWVALTGSNPDCSGRARSLWRSDCVNATLHTLHYWVYFLDLVPYCFTYFTGSEKCVGKVGVRWAM
jgi:hypothetical protein